MLSDIIDFLLVGNFQSLLSFNSNSVYISESDLLTSQKVFTFLLILCSIPYFLLYYVDSYWLYFVLSALFGMVGTSFAVGIAFTSVWYPKNWQGRALGIFGMGNAGAAITTLLAPSLLNYLSENDHENGWRMLPIFYGIALLIIGFIFMFFVKNNNFMQ